MTDGQVFGCGYNVGVNDACMIDECGDKILYSAVREFTLLIEGLISCFNTSSKPDGGFIHAHIWLTGWLTD